MTEFYWSTTEGFDNKIEIYTQQKSLADFQKLWSYDA